MLVATPDHSIVSVTTASDLPQTVNELPTYFRSLAAVSRLLAGAESAACAYEYAARCIERALVHKAEEVLTLAEAAALSGYSADHLARRIREGTLPNAGRPNAPRLRRADVPIKPTRRRVAAHRSLGYDVDADARSLGCRRGGR